MIDVKDTILKFKLERAKNYISIVNLLDFIKSSNPTANFAEIVDYLLIKLKENNPRTTTQYDSYEKIYTYRLPINSEESIQECSDCFFEILEGARSAFLDHMDCLYESLLGNLRPDQPYLNEGAAEAIGRLAVNFIPENDCFVAISKPQIERLLGFKIPLDGEITQSETTKPRKDNLETQITQLDQNAVIKNKDNYIEELEARIEQLQQNKNQLNQTIANQDSRISQAQRDLFSLLVMNCYPDFQSRNALFEAINADLRRKGIRQADIQYPTFDRLIDERLRINNKSPFPPKQK